MMKNEVRYFSKTGNTKKLAEEIATVAGCTAKSIDSPVTAGTDILFLGVSVYWGGIDKKVKDFIASLESKNIKKVVVFSTSAMAERAYPAVRKYLKERGIQVESRSFYCRGQFSALHKNRPNAADLKDAREFARTFL